MEILWEKIQFWKKPLMKYKEGLDYDYVNFKNTEVTGIKLLSGGYEGVVFHYGKARVVEEGELAKLQFGYTIVHPGKHNIDDLNNDEMLHTIMGDLLTQFLMSRITNEETGTNNTEESDLQ